MITEALIVILVATPLMFIAMVVYVALLLATAKRFNGYLKFMISMVIYIAFCPVVVAPLIYLFGRFGNSPVLAVVSWIMIMAPAFHYLVKVRLRELQHAGYFLPR